MCGVTHLNLLSIRMQNSTCVSLKSQKVVNMNYLTSNTVISKLTEECDKAQIIELVNGFC